MGLQAGFAKASVEMVAERFVTTQDTKTLPSNFQNNRWSIRDDRIAMLAARDGSHLTKNLTNSQGLRLESIDDGVDILEKDSALSVDGLNLLKRYGTLFVGGSRLTAVAATFATIAFGEGRGCDGAGFESLFEPFRPGRGVVRVGRFATRLP